MGWKEISLKANLPVQRKAGKSAETQTDISKYLTVTFVGCNFSTIERNETSLTSNKGFENKYEEGKNSGYK